MAAAIMDFEGRPLLPVGTLSRARIEFCPLDILGGQFDV